MPSFLRGSQMLASMPSLLASGVMRGFVQTRIPLAPRTQTLAELPMFIVWHQHYQKDPAHRWIRGQLETVAATVAKARHQDPCLSEDRPPPNPLVAEREPR